MTKRKIRGHVPTHVILDARLNHTALKVYGALRAYAGKEKKCWPRVEDIAEIAGVSRRPTQLALRCLEATGYVRTLHSNDWQQGSPSEYFLLDSREIAA
ncbi:helix-turn-helix domain-containing protein [Pseudovibrio ascidiaceicola]|uniref:helix-turn-helix domain-containing protein n=1 Tax=Pseudovibrio ascidiaceicola TaxID=285279 RepID=UPI003D35DD45